MVNTVLSYGSENKIVFIYVDGEGNKKKEVVTMPYMDKEHCYFRTTNTLGFNKPKWRTKAEVIVYAPEGVYDTVLIIRDVTFSFNEILFEVDIPKKWNFTQLRAGIRKCVELPLTITFSDGVTIETKTTEISIGGFSCVLSSDLTSVQKGFPGKGVVKFPESSNIEGELEAEVKYVRQKELGDIFGEEGKIRYGFKFNNLSSELKIKLKHYLMQLK